MLNLFLFLFILELTVLFSFLPEKYLTPYPAKTSSKSKIMQSFLVTLLFLVVTLIVQRPIFSALAVSIFLIILSGVSNAKYRALREPLVYSDIAMFSQAFKHPRLYFPFLGLIPVILMPLIIIALIALVLWLEPAMAFTPIRIISTLAIIFICFVLAKNHAVDMKLSEEPETDNQQYGLLNSLFAYAIQARSDEHKQKIKRVLEESPFALKSSKSSATPETAQISNEKTPSYLLPVSPEKPNNITIIQSESFFDARRMHQNISNDVLENYDNVLSESIQFGKLNVPAWGANTMRTEFSFLTGLKYEDMGLYRYYPYQFLHKMPVVSLAKLLQAQGYHCVCIHPHPASFFGRDRIFPQMGFDEFIDIESFDKQQTFGPYISDQAVTDKILEISNKYQDKPLFIFAITMENHGPLHLEKTTKGEQQQYYSEEPIDDINDLTVYLRHLKNADNMVEQLTSAYRNLYRDKETPTTLCFYGDHIPSMPKIYQALSYEDRDSDYFIWNNQVSTKPSKQTIPSTKSDISVDSLAETLLRQTGNIES